MPNPQILAVAADDRALSAALAAAGLPTDDLGAVGQRFFALEIDGRRVAHGGLDGSGRDRLLRSVVVEEAARGRGHARRLVAAIAAAAAADGAVRLWLLTTTAADVFAGLGWRRVGRDEAPPAIAALPQFAGLCPASAVCMVRDVGPTS